ncbi:hypothetical protein MBLNU459_g2696t1 [Dothideomycetes sp. NU459]
MPRPSIITPTPFRSSRLSSPPSPFSPRLPVNPPSSPPKPVRSPIKVSGASPPPKIPLHWLWQCHVCHRQYRLGVTRRCLEDGHYLCVGTTTTHRGSNGSRKVKRHRACSSEFDYQGWKNWGKWRRSILVSPTSDASDTATDNDDDDDAAAHTHSVVSPLYGTHDPEADVSRTPPPESAWFRGIGRPSPEKSRVLPPEKDCWHRCDYPSECRWGDRFGVQSPAAELFTLVPEPALNLPELERVSSTTATTPATEFGHFLSAEQMNAVDVVDGGDSAGPADIGMQDVGALVVKAARRKSRSHGLTHSPLASDPSESAEHLALGLREMALVDSSLVEGEPSQDVAVKRNSVSSAMLALNGIVDAVIDAVSGPAAVEDDRAQVLVRTLRLGRKRKATPEGFI